MIKKNFGFEDKPAESEQSIINEAIDLEKRIIFIAIPKTGSTSVSVQLKQGGTPIIKNPHLNIQQIRDLIYVHLLKSALGENLEFPTENVPDNLTLKNRSIEIFDACFKFSAVRNPWARAASLYFRNKGRREGRREINANSFEEFCRHHLYASDRCTHPTLHKNQYDWFCDENGENLMDYIYKMENFAEAIVEIKNRTEGRLNLEYLHKNKNRHSPVKNYRDLYNDATRQIIAKRFEKDIDLFKYTF